MELLFNKAPHNGSTELKELLGFIDADIEFSKIKPDMITATNELLKLIGKPMYEKVLEIYGDDEADEDQEHLLYLTRYPLAVRAYMLLAPSNDVAHTSDGRKMRQDDNQKQAFEWMLDRDNEALERRYYRSLDDLLLHLDGMDEWKETEAFKATHELFIRTTYDFDSYFSIDSRLVLLKLAPGISQCETNEVLPRIGRQRYDALKELVKSGAVPEPEDSRLIELIKEACVYHALAWAMMRMSVHIFPEGILQAYTSDRMSTKGKNPALKSEPEAARQAFTHDRDLALSKIEEFVREPESTETDDDDDIDGFLFGNNYISM